MKKILLSLFGIITLGLINFSNAGTYTLTGTLTAGNCSNYNGTYYISVPNSYFLNGGGNSTSVSCGFLDDGGSITSAVFYQPTNQNFTITNSNNLITCPTGFSNYICYGNLNGTIISYMIFKVNFHTYDSDNLCHLKFFCTFSGNTIVNQSDLDPTCQSDLSSCQSDLNICQNSSSSCSPSGSCSVNDKLTENIIYSGSVSLNNSSYTNIFNYGDNGAGTYCVKLTSSSPQTLTFGFANGGTTAPTNLYTLYNDQYNNWVCLYGNKAYFNAKLNSSLNTVSYEVYKLTDLLSDDIPCTEGTGSSCDYSDYILISDVTKNYCTNKFSDLISEEDITQGYCETEFGLIDPENCPSSGGTGDVNWSSFWVNNTQIQGASSIYLYLPDFLSWDYTYINTGSTLQIDVENEGDQEYINNILDIQSYHPDKDQFAMSFAGFLTLLMPYIIITLFIIFVWKLIRRIFR